MGTQLIGTRHLWRDCLGHPRREVIGAHLALGYGRNKETHRVLLGASVHGGARERGIVKEGYVELA